MPGAIAEGAVVQIEGLIKRYNDREVVRGISLSIPRGRCFGVLGPNGAGKTTTLRMLLGQSPRNGGRVTVFGLPIPEQTRAVRRRAGVVPQADNLDPDFTVAENLRIYGSYFGLPAKSARCQHSRTARLRRTRRPRGYTHQHALRRHEAPAHHRPRADQRPGADRAR